MRLIVASVLCFASAVTAAAEPSCVITDFGILGDAREVMVKPGTGTATGKERFFEPAPIHERTDRIPARLGLRFGVKHQFSEISPERALTFEILHPPMKSLSGELKTESRGRKNPRDVGSAYGFDSPTEVLPGQWTFRFVHDGKLLCEKTFTVYAE